MADPITVGVSTSVAVRLIPTALLATGKSLWHRDVIQRATTQLELQFPRMRRELRETVKNWISDDAVIDSVRTLKVGGARIDVTETIVDAFLAHSTISGLTREAAERFIVAFWSALEQEASKEESGPWRQENIIRHEAESIRQEIGREGQRTRAALLETQRLLLQAVFESEDEDRRWDRRIDDANRLLGERKIRSALSAYEQILDDSSGKTCPARIRYRLHANIGTCHMSLGRWPKAGTHFQRALDAVPDEALPHWQLGQIRLHEGDTDAAIEHAEAAIALDRADVHGWLIKAQAQPNLELDDLPSAVCDTAEFWILRAQRAFENAQFPQMDQFARKALGASHRSAEQLVNVAELLFLAHSGLPLSHIPVTVREDIVRLTSEALDKLDYHEYPNLAARALTVRGNALINDAHDAAYDDFVTAIGLRPDDIGPKVGQADVLLRMEDYSAALFALRTVPVDCGDVRVHALRARIMVHMEPTNPEIEAEIMRGVDALTAGGGPAGFLLDLADIATRAQLVGVSNRILSGVDAEAAPAVVSVFRARIAVTEDEFDLAEQAYDVALSRAAPAEQRDILIEFAGFLSFRGLHQRAADALRLAGVIDGPDRLREFFAIELIQSGQWKRLQELVEQARSDDGLPDWALDAAAMLALRRDDLVSARAYLTEMLSRGVSDSSVSIRLAYALLRMGEPEEAVSTLDELFEEEQLDGSIHADAAKLYFQAGHYEAAIRTAYLGWRRDPSHPELELILIGTTLQAPDDLPITSDPDVVAVDTWVRLQDIDGTAETSYFITKDQPLPGRSDEITADSAAAKLLLGKKVNDTVVLQPRGIDPVEYRVREIRTAVVRTVQDGLQRVGTTISDDQPIIQSIRVGTPDSVRFLAPVLSTLYKGQASKEWARKLYHERRLPLARFATLAGVSIRKAYAYLTSAHDEVLFTDSGQPNFLHAATVTARNAREVVISTTALFTLQELELLPLLCEVYDRVFSPPSLLELLQQERAELVRHLEKGSVSMIVPGPMGIEVLDTSADAMRREVDALDVMIEFLRAHTCPINRPVESLEDGREYIRRGLGDAEMDALLAATEDRPLFADDQGLRAIAAEEFGVPTFSTFFFLEAAEGRGLLARERRLRATVALIEAGHSFVPISAELLFVALRDDGMVLGTKLTAVLRRLTAEADPQSAVPVAVAFLREVATHPLSQVAFRGAVWALLDIFYRVPDQGNTLQMFDTLAEGALRLLPVTYSSYQTERDAFKLAKEMFG